MSGMTTTMSTLRTSFVTMAMSAALGDVVTLNDWS
jgi:hypothetical protein